MLLTLNLFQFSAQFFEDKSAWSNSIVDPIQMLSFKSSIPPPVPPALSNDQGANVNQRKFHHSKVSFGNLAALIKDSISKKYSEPQVRPPSIHKRNLSRGKSLEIAFLEIIQMSQYEARSQSPSSNPTLKTLEAFQKHDFELKQLCFQDFPFPNCDFFFQGLELVVQLVFNPKNGGDLLQGPDCLE